MSNSNINSSGESQKVILSISGLHKKFCQDLKYNMYHGMSDMTQRLFGIQPNYSTLRKKEFWAINDLNVDIFEGQITALVGTNGSGKTTLIRMLAGIYDVERGEIKYDECVKKALGIFAIKSGFHNILTGRENIYLKCSYFGLTEAQVNERMDFITSFSGLNEHLESPMGKYSSGMKTRLAMSIVLSIKGDVLFIDEGFSFSDPGFKSKCFDFLTAEYTKKGKALIIATHRMGKIKDFANRVLLLDRGKLVADEIDVKLGLEKYLKLCKDRDN